MQWFEGNIPEAIAESQRRKIVFVVFVEDQSEDSVKMNSTLSDAKVGAACAQDACVAIKMNVNSQQCQQFSAIYPLVCVPVIYFIGSRGLPLEVVGGAVSADELVNKATSAFEAFKASTQSEVPAQSTSTSAAQPAQISRQDSPIASNTSEEQSTSQEAPAPTAAASNLSLDDRVQRAKQLMEEPRKQKVENVKEGEKNTEAKRRKEGQEMLKAKEELESKKAQMIQQKIKENKAKERARREEVREQIARDKAERDAMRLREKQERQATPGTANSTSPAPGNPVDSKSYENARLQFRFPDGSSVTNMFPANAILEAPRQFVVSLPNASSFTSGIKLFTTFPRRELTDEDLMKTLSDLGLTPSSTLIVLPKKQVRSVQSSSASGLVLWILSPLFALINFIKILLLGSPSQPRGVYGENSSSNRHTSTDSSGVRRREGIHQLRQTEDDDDENNTWNGNSTQQM